jgi:hypothetical protein
MYAIFNEPTFLITSSFFIFLLWAKLAARRFSEVGSLEVPLPQIQRQFAVVMVNCCGL